jgi:hypothetical protein
MPRTTTTSRSTIWSSPKRMLATASS